MRQTLVSHCPTGSSLCVHIAAGACLLHNADQLRHCCQLPVKKFNLTQKVFGCRSKVLKGGFFRIFQYFFPHCFVCRPSDSTLGGCQGQTQDSQDCCDFGNSSQTPSPIGQISLTLGNISSTLLMINQVQKQKILHLSFYVEVVKPVNTMSYFYRRSSNIQITQLVCKDPF